MLYTTRQLKIGKSEQLDFLASQAGDVYSETVVTFWRVHRRNNHWLSSNAMQKLIRNRDLHSQTVQGIIQTFYEGLKSWNALRRNSSNAKPPRRLSKYHSIPFKSSAIKIMGGMLTLSTGRGNEPIRIPWKFQLPKVCEITFNGREYVLNAVYAAIIPETALGSGYAGVDFGQVHIAVVNTGVGTFIANGHELRSKRLYQNKVKKRFQYKMDKCVRHSRKWKRLNRARARALCKLNNQARDILHKQTNAIVCVMEKEGIQTVGIGNVRNMRKNVGYRVPVGTVRSMVAYKSQRIGMTVEFIDDEYYRCTCPRCIERNITDDRIYLCAKCGFEHHLDRLGAISIRNFTKYREYVPVIGDMTPPVGIRYYADTSRTSAARSA